MAMMHEKAHARQGRGGANACSDKWYNAPLWENTGPKKRPGVEKEPVAEEQLTEEQKLKRRQQALLRAIY